MGMKYYGNPVLVITGAITLDSKSLKIVKVTTSDANIVAPHQEVTLVIVIAEIANVSQQLVTTRVKIILTTNMTTQYFALMMLKALIMVTAILSMMRAHGKWGQKWETQLISLPWQNEEL